MKSLQSLIFEAGAPSKLTKKKSKTIKKTNTYSFGDKYDSNSGFYTQEDSYFQSESTGYIMDKDGNKHLVVDGTHNEDAGAIAGGSIYWKIFIQNVGDVKKLIVSGYQGIMSSPSTPSAPSIVADIENGYYLEDYLAIHKKDIALGARDKVKDIIAKGDANALSYKKIKSDKAANKEKKFWLNYGIIRHGLQICKIKDGKINNEVMYIEAHHSLKDVKGTFFNEIKDTEISKKLSKEAGAAIAEAIEPLLKKNINPDLSDLEGVDVWIGFKMGDNTEISKYDNTVAFDMKNKKFVLIQLEDAVIGKVKKNTVIGDVEPYIIALYLGGCKTEFGKELLVKAGKDYEKSRKKILKDYVEANYHKFFAQTNYLKGKAREAAKEKFNNDTAKVVNGKVQIPFEFLAKYCKSGEVVADPSEEKKDKKAADQDKPIKGGQEKMDAWHNGTRKQNVKSCSDDKLKAYYKICVDSGYNEEAEKLRSEADSRGLKLNESISLETYAELF